MSSLESGAPHKPLWAAPYSAFIALVTLVLVGTIGIYLYKNNQTKSNDGKTAQTSSQASRSLTVAQKATARLSVLTGVPATEVQQAVVFAEKSAQDGRGAAKKGIIQTPTPAPVLDAQQYDQKVMYRKDMIEIGPAAQKEKEILGYSSYFMGNSAGGYTTESWNSTNYNKYVVQTDKVIQLYLNTPLKNTEYRGGKYAIEQTFSSPNYMSSITLTTNENPEFYFLKSIISDTTGMYKKVRDDVINNRAVEVYEVQSSAGYPPTIDTQKMMAPAQPSSEGAQTSSAKNLEEFARSQKIYYYVDTANFEMIRTESMAGSELIGRQTLVKSEVLTGENTKNIFEFAPLAGVSVRSIAAPDYSSYLSQSQFETIASQYLVAYVAPFSVKNNSSYLPQFQSEDQYRLLRDSTEFDPLYVPYPSIDDAKMLFSAHMGSISTDGYEKKPGGYLLSYNDPTQVPTTVSISIGGVLITAEKYTTDIDISLVFSQNNVWYLIRVNPDFSLVSHSADGTYTPPPMPALPAVFSVLTSAEGQKIDTQVNAEQKNVTLFQHTELDAIPAAMKLLIGDASADKLIPTDAAQSSKTKDLCDVTVFVTSASQVQQCLTERYNGWMLSYFMADNRNSFSYDITQSVLDTPLSSINFDAFKVSIQDSNDLEKPIVETSEGITKVSFGSVEKYTQQVLFFREVNGKTVIVSPTLYGTTMQNDPGIALAKKLIMQVALNKDIDIINDQIKKVNTGIYGDAIMMRGHGG
jgi:hypothetical protein